jgi:hypothetical protein
MDHVVAMAALKRLTELKDEFAGGQRLDARPISTQKLVHADLKQLSCWQRKAIENLRLAYLNHTIADVVKDKMQEAFVAEAVAIGDDIRVGKHGNGLNFSLRELLIWWECHLENRYWMELLVN